MHATQMPARRLPQPQAETSSFLPRLSCCLLCRSYDGPMIGQHRVTDLIDRTNTSKSCQPPPPQPNRLPLPRMGTGTTPSASPTSRPERTPHANECDMIARGASSGSPAAAKGLGKKALGKLPKLAYEAAVARGGAEERILAECAICLSEFAPEEEIRVLPQCAHGFHVACVDTWLGAHSSCPSCRRVLVVDEPPERPPDPKRCRNCEAAAVEEASSSSGSGGVTDTSNKCHAVMDEPSSSSGTAGFS